jgi:hypothetical protein
MILSLIQAPAFDMTSVVSVSVLIVVLGAAWRLSSLLSRIDERLRQALAELEKLSAIPGKVALLEQRMTQMESEVGELWEWHRKAP